MEVTVGDNLPKCKKKITHFEKQKLAKQFQSSFTKNVTYTTEQ